MQQYFSLLKSKRNEFRFIMILFHFNIILILKMTQYNMLNVKSSNSQFNNLKSAIKNGFEVTLNFSSNIIDDCNDENNFPLKLLLILKSQAS